MLRAGTTEDGDEAGERNIGEIAAQIYRFLWAGEYKRADGTRQKIDGDTSKILNAIGLNQRQKSLIQNYQFM